MVSNVKMCKVYQVIPGSHRHFYDVKLSDLLTHNGTEMHTVDLVMPDWLRHIAV